MLLPTSAKDPPYSRGEAGYSTFPDYHYALSYLAQVRIAQKRSGEAVALLRRLCTALPRA